MTYREEGIRVWGRAVCAARISSKAKLVAFCMGHAYVDAASVSFDTALLVVESGLTWAAVIRGRDELAEVGLIELVDRENNEYRLAVDGLAIR